MTQEERKRVRCCHKDMCRRGLLGLRLRPPNSVFGGLHQIKSVPATSNNLRARPDRGLQAEQSPDGMQVPAYIPSDVVRNIVRDAESDGEIDLIGVEVLY